MIADSGTVKTFDNGFKRDMGVKANGEPKGRMDLLPWAAIREVSIHSEMGAEKYGEGNIQKHPCPQKLLYSSAFRHLSKVLDPEEGDVETKIVHLRAACWNMLWALEQYTNGTSDMDKPVIEDDYKCKNCMYYSLNPQSEWYLKCCLTECAFVDRRLP